MPSPAYGQFSSASVEGFIPVTPSIVPVTAGPISPIVDPKSPEYIKGQIEASLGSARLTTAFVGNIADGITDELLGNMFSACGEVKKWKRVLDVAGTPKTFGFLEFASAEGLLRLLRLLPNILLMGKNLNIKVDDQTKEYLGKFENAVQGYEATHKDSPNLSSTLEDDLKALEEINLYLKQKNLTSGMQFIEDKVRELTSGPSKEPQAPIAMEMPVQPASYRQPKESEQRASLTGWETSGYREREKRWEKREEEMERNRQQQQTRENERAERDKREKERLLQSLQTFDDSAYFLLTLEHLSVKERSIERKLASLNVSQFYMERSHWRERRRRELQKQLEFDAREAQREVEREVPSSRVNKVLGSASGEALGKRQQFSDGSQFGSKRQRIPLVTIEYDYAELISAGYDPESAKEKLLELKKEKIKKLVERIPVDRDALFQWDLDWDLVDINKALAWIDRNLDNVPGIRDKQTLASWLERKLLNQSSPLETVRSLELPQEEAELFVMRLWRYLVYESEARAYNLN